MQGYFQKVHFKRQMTPEKLVDFLENEIKNGYRIDSVLDMRYGDFLILASPMATITIENARK